MSKELVALLKRTLRMPWEAHLRPSRWVTCPHEYLKVCAAIIHYTQSNESSLPSGPTKFLTQSFHL